MAVQAVGGVAAAGQIAPANINAVEPSGAGARQARQASGESPGQSTLVISKVTRTKDDGSTVTTITYADGHTETETTPPRFSANENRRTGEGQVAGPQGTGSSRGVRAGGNLASSGGGEEGRITGVDILA